MVCFVVGKKMSYLIRSLFLLCLVPGSVLAQDALPPVEYDLSYHSRFVSSLLERPQMSNTGSANIQIPIYTVSTGSISIPIALNYNTGGIKVSQRPTIVGLGWSLSNGGIVTRIPRGTIDEYEFLVDFDDWSAPQTFNYPASYDVSYIGNYARLDRNDWDEQTFKDHIYNTPEYAYLPSEFASLATVNIDLSPDEFQFSVNNISGSFFMDHKGKWIVKCDKPVRVEVDHMNDYTVFPPPHQTYGAIIKIPRAIYKITITDEAGNQYIFGNHHDAVELFRNVVPNGGSPGRVNTREYTNDVMTVAWYLSKVISADGDEINLQYKAVHQLNSRLEPMVYFLSTSQYGSMKYLSKSLVRAPVIEKISTSKGLVIDFITGISPQLDYDIPIKESENTGEYGYSEETIYTGRAFLWYRDIHPGVKATMIQLNEIRVKYLNEVREKVTFGYSNVTNQRLKLLSVNFHGKGLSAQQPISYSFEYNPMLLPGYNSGMEDLLGFYNGVNYFSSFSQGASFTLSQLTNNYLPTRESNATYMAAESLIKINNPMGGSVEYEYEPNSYHNYIGFGNHSVVSLTTSKITGGLRIKKITVRQNSGSPAKVTDFFYVKDYQTNPNSVISSGVLFDDLTSQLITNYSQGGPPSATSWRVKHRITSDRKSNESPVTYSEITTFEPGKGYTIRKFSNYTTSQTDAIPFFGTPANFFPFSTPAIHLYDKRDIDRGKLLLEEVYNNARQLVQKTENRYYFQDFTEKPHIRSVQYLKKHINSSYIAYSFIAWPQYYYNNHLTMRELTQYDYTGGVTKSIKQTEKYFYTNTEYPQLLTRVEKTDSKGNTNMKEFKYAPDFENTATIFDEMVDRNMTGLPVVQTDNIIKGAVTTELSRSQYNYSLWNSNTLLKPANIQNSFKGAAIVPGDLAQTDAIVDNYDANGNILQQTSKNGIVSMQWGYSALYPVVKIVNARNLPTLKEFYYEGFESEMHAARTVKPFAGRQYRPGDFTVPFAKPNTRVYKINYRYLEGGVWKNFTGDFTNNMTLTNGDAIDEVRVYPEDAQMATCTYDPYVGLTSEIDFEGKITYREYDGFGRLVLLLDQDRNILKKICYNYTGQTENCNLFYNSLVTTSLGPDNCPPGYAGNTVLYTVPGKMYVASSQADADALALAETQDIGQAYANANASCYQIIVNVHSGNSSQYAVQVSLFNTATFVTYDFTLNPNSFVPVGQVPSGIYNITMTSTDPNATNYTYQVLGHSQTAANAYFPAVQLYTTNCSLVVQ